MNADDPRHGTRAGYLTHRRDCEDACQPCHAAHKAYCKRYDLKVARGYRPRVPADKVRTYIATLVEKGMTPASIARAAGTPHSVVARITEGQRTVTRRVASAILAVDEQVPVAGYIRSEGSKRRLNALHLNGFPLAQIARETGIERRTITYVSNGQRKFVEAKTAAAIVEFFDAHWDKQPEPSDRYQAAAITRARDRSQAKRHAPAMAWDDLDDCREHAKGLEGTSNLKRWDAIADDYHDLRLDGYPLDEIANRLGMRLEALERALERHQDDPRAQKPRRAA